MNSAGMPFGAGGGGGGGAWVRSSLIFRSSASISSLEDTARRSLAPDLRLGGKGEYGPSTSESRCRQFRFALALVPHLGPHSISERGNRYQIRRVYQAEGLHFLFFPHAHRHALSPSCSEVARPPWVSNPGLKLTQPGRWCYIAVLVRERARSCLQAQPAEERERVEVCALSLLEPVGRASPERINCCKIFQKKNTAVNMEDKLAQPTRDWVHVCMERTLAVASPLRHSVCVSGVPEAV